MGPEKPPRRTKTDQTPVTIDLEPNAPEAETPVVGPFVATTEPDPLPETGAATQDTKLSGDEIVAPAGKDDEAAAERDEHIREAAATFAEEPASPADAHSASLNEPKTPQPRASNTASLAAGIVGGLIALLAAGGLQYAGILPALDPGGGGDQSLQTLAVEVEAIKTQLSAKPSATTGANVDIAPLEGRIAKLESTAGATGDAAAGIPGLTAQVDALNGEIAALKSQLAETRQTTETASTELSTRIDAAEKKIDAPASDVQLARAVAVTALKTAIDRGGPFLAELDALRSIAASDPAVTGLAEDAATGVASRKDLTTEFPDVADAMLAAIRGADPNQGVFSRLMDSAASVVRVRPVGSVEGAGPQAVVARIEDKLTNGDLKGATIEWEALPAEAKTAGADFKTRLDQRLRVEGLIDTAVSGALTPNQG